MLSKEEEKALRQQWRTPDTLFDWASNRFGKFHIDVAADDNNTLCNVWLDDAFNDPWFSYGCHAAWCNPPYTGENGGIASWLERAHNQTRPYVGSKAVLCLPYDVSVKWYLTAERLCSEIVFIKGSRVKFVPDPKLQEHYDDVGKKHSGPTGATAFFVFENTTSALRHYGVEL